VGTLACACANCVSVWVLGYVTIVAPVFSAFSCGFAFPRFPLAFVLCLQSGFGPIWRASGTSTFRPLPGNFANLTRSPDFARPARSVLSAAAFLRYICRIFHYLLTLTKVLLIALSGCFFFSRFPGPQFSHTHVVSRPP